MIAAQSARKGSLLCFCFISRPCVFGVQTPSLFVQQVGAFSDNSRQFSCNFRQFAWAFSGDFSQFLALSSNFKQFRVTLGDFGGQKPRKKLLQLAKRRLRIEHLMCMFSETFSNQGYPEEGRDGRAQGWGRMGGRGGMGALRDEEGWEGGWGGMGWDHGEGWDGEG